MSAADDSSPLGRHRVEYVARMVGSKQCLSPIYQSVRNSPSGPPRRTFCRIDRRSEKCRIHCTLRRLTSNHPSYATQTAPLWAPFLLPHAPARGAPGPRTLAHRQVFHPKNSPFTTHSLNNQNSPHPFHSKRKIAPPEPVGNTPPPPTTPCQPAKICVRSNSYANPRE